MSDTYQENSNSDLPSVIHHASISKCPNCGANTVFDPNTQKLKCNHCDSDIDFEKYQVADKADISKLTAKTGVWDDTTKTFRCDNCGASSVVSSHEITKQCPYCHASNFVEIDSLSTLVPDAVIPFLIDKKEAAKIAKNWAKGKLYAPKKYKQSFSTEDLRGIYNPVFAFDSDTFTDYDGRLGKHYTVTVGTGKNQHTEIRTRWFSINGDFDMQYEDIMIQASTQISQRTMQAIEPFDLYQNVAFDDAYLYGFFANTYDRDGAQCWSEAKVVIDKNIRNSVLSRYSYDVIDYLNINTSYDSIKYRYTLMPVYVGYSEWKSKKYNLFINGQHGKIYGKYPVSGLKVFNTVLLSLLAIGGIALGIYFGTK